MCVEYNIVFLIEGKSSYLASWVEIYSVFSQHSDHIGVVIFSRKVNSTEISLQL